MKHIKVWLIVLLCGCIAPMASAQIYQSKSYVKKTKIEKEYNPWKKFQGYAKVSARIPTHSSCDYKFGVSGMPGFEVGLGFKLRMGRHGWYWGMDGNFLTKGVKFNAEEKFIGDSKVLFGGRLEFTRFGWRAKIGNIITDLHFGFAVEANTERPLTTNEYENGINVNYDCSQEIAQFVVPIGFGASYKKVFLDLSYLISTKQGVWSSWWKEYYNRHVYDKDIILQNLLITVGYHF